MNEIDNTTKYFCLQKYGKKINVPENLNIPVKIFIVENENKARTPWIIWTEKIYI